ncbi:MAG: HAD-IA family hydrolase [Nitratireductor sp.]|nr:HAD-IA family hydrolase [Nitratireductor sp.]
MRLVLFDVDGTLLDSAALIHACMCDAFADFGLPPPRPEASRAIIGLTLDRAIARVLDREIDDQVNALTVRYKEVWLDNVGKPELQSPFFPGMLDLIHDLAGRDDLLLGMVTGKSRRGVVRLLDQYGLHAHFVTSRTADDCPSKPHPAMVLECCSETGMAAHDTVVIGDTSYDMEMARSAGALAIGVSWGYHSVESLRASGAGAIASDAGAIPSLVETLLPRG